LHSRNHVTREDALAFVDPQVLGGPEPKLLRPHPWRRRVCVLTFVATLVAVLYYMPQIKSELWPTVATDETTATVKP
jgi:hypothetical protein